MAWQLRRTKDDWNDCRQKTVQGALWLAKRLSRNINFSFLCRISLLLTSSSYPVASTKLGGFCFRPYIPRQISTLTYSREMNPVYLGWYSDMLITKLVIIIIIIIITLYYVIKRDRVLECTCVMCSYVCEICEFVCVCVCVCVCVWKYEWVSVFAWVSESMS